MSAFCQLTVYETIEETDQGEMTRRSSKESLWIALLMAFAQGALIGLMLAPWALVAAMAWLVGLEHR